MIPMVNEFSWPTSSHECLNELGIRWQAVGTFFPSTKSLPLSSEIENFHYCEQEYSPIQIPVLIVSEALLKFQTFRKKTFFKQCYAVARKTISFFGAVGLI
jgi:hypothetical protein